MAFAKHNQGENPVVAAATAAAGHSTPRTEPKWWRRARSTRSRDLASRPAPAVSPNSAPCRPLQALTKHSKPGSTNQAHPTSVVVPAAAALEHPSSRLRTTPRTKSRTASCVAGNGRPGSSARPAGGRAARARPDSNSVTERPPDPCSFVLTRDTQDATCDDPRCLLPVWHGQTAASAGERSVPTRGRWTSGPQMTSGRELCPRLGGLDATRIALAALNERDVAPTDPATT
jgi:hypothetical protein